MKDLEGNQKNERHGWLPKIGLLLTVEAGCISSAKTLPCPNPYNSCPGAPNCSISWDPIFLSLAPNHFLIPTPSHPNFQPTHLIPRLKELLTVSCCVKYRLQAWRWISAWSGQSWSAAWALESRGAGRQTALETPVEAVCAWVTSIYNVQAQTHGTRLRLFI